MSRTTVDLNEDLLREAMRRTHAKTKKETLERGLQELINAERRRALIERSGKGFGVTLRDLSRMRRDE